MKKRLSILLILGAAFFCAAVHAAVLPVSCDSVSDPASAYLGGGASSADEQLEQDIAEARRRLDALIDAIRSYANRRHALT
ncbi:MAG: hypothetical protein JXA62_02995, partial [Candidatus Aminicenantes bacterium]|nr:hypothetical protein [Candidatus Aminicenantes bacterium]